MFMQEEQTYQLQKNISLFGRFLCCCDRQMSNAKLYIKRHSISIEICFLLIYTLLNLILVYFVRTQVISIFIIIFLFFLGLERLIIHLKLNMDKELLERREEQIKEQSDSYTRNFNEIIKKLEKKNNILERENDALRLSLRLKNKR